MAEPVEWMMVAKGHANFTVGASHREFFYASTPPPEVFVPELKVRQGYDPHAYGDLPYVAAIGPAAWIIHYPRAAGTPPSTKWIEYTHGYYVRVLDDSFLGEQAKYEVPNIRSFPEGFFPTEMVAIHFDPAAQGHFCIADLKTVVDEGGERVLRLYSLHQGMYSNPDPAWEVKDFRGLPVDPEWFCWGTVFYHGTKICWIDHNRGIYAWDAFGDQDLVHIPLPQYQFPADATIRRVQFSAGRFRLVEVYYGDRRNQTRVSVRTLRDEGPAPAWAETDYTFEFGSDIWNTQAFISAALPHAHGRRPHVVTKIEGMFRNFSAGVPVFACMSPVNPDRLYFFARDDAPADHDELYRMNLYGVDGRARTFLHRNKRKGEEGAPDSTLKMGRMGCDITTWVIPQVN